MRLWILLGIVCIVQEFASTSAVFLSAYHAGYSLWIIHLMYACGTVIDLVAGYFLGSWVHRRYGAAPISMWAQNLVQRYKERFGNVGMRYVLFLIGSFNFTFIDAFLIPWLGVSWLEAFVIFFVADIVWYAFQWSFILGVNLLLPDPLVALFAVIVISLAAVGIWKLANNGLFGRW